MTSPRMNIEAEVSNSSSSDSSREGFSHGKGHEELHSAVTTPSSTPNISSAKFLPAAVTAEIAPSLAFCQPKPPPGLYRESSSRIPSDSRALHAYPIAESTKHQPLDTLYNMMRRRQNQPNHISPSLVAPQIPSLTSDSSGLLTHIQDLENKLAILQAKVMQTTEEPSGTNIDQQHLPNHRVSEGELVGTNSSDPSQINPWIVEIKRYKKLNYRFGSAELYDDSESIEAIRAKESAARGGGYILNVYREYDWEGNALNSKLEICSTPLLEVIRDVIAYYPGPEFDLLRWEETAGDTVTFSEPYMMLFTHRTELNDCLQRPDIPQETKSHIGLLLQFLREDMPRTSAKLDEIKAGTCKKIAFHDLWLLYPPNTPVYISANGQDRQMVVYSRNVPEKNMKGQWGVLSLYCWSAKYEGEHLNRDFYPWVIQPYHGEKALDHLELIPMQYLPNQDAVRSRLIARGNRYFQLNRGPVLQDYQGDHFPRVFKDEPIRVIVDQDTYWRKHGIEAPRNDDPSEEYGFPKGEDLLEDSEGHPLQRALVCCYPKVGIFSMRDKEWASVRVDDLHPVKFREKAFKRLVIKDEYKKLIIAMVQANMMEDPGFTDIVGGKGRGLTVLLHGPPGTGKTLTAECIAEKQQRPLYSVSCGDLGTEPFELEKRLKEIFSYAVAWKAILLMDEADIFLQERDVHNVSRNALVSIFLRELEYFDGILFLTTNRPGDIDEAFQSRIHVSIGLKALDTVERRKVWSIFIREMDLSDKDKAALMTHVTDKFDNDRLNGRQIRNAMRIAIALANVKKEKLTPDHLDRVIKIGREFSDYMEDLNKMSQEDYAVALGRRGPTA
ncbi:hypothetical protein EPUS_05477 [Endocarpon pusillum Z07020]|uniref:AAA+ ATPase domain-containing protein n=1 Tax=Endocarpon pusillum (strain Z07020 / HMAS-L-300199) TaxID=1263415 RepID=U1GCZ4_ENDPU|nr:uncharacterized protein EPUS_05477 [Endocarpon pusillum Z07020]ERF69933.1 hypothetical protein EPUS_05477 [Endocarpon pusillum Z07020]